MPNPHSEYTERLNARQAVADHLGELDHRFAQARLGIAALGALMGWMTFAEQMLALWWMSIPVAAFVLLVVFHERLRRRCDRAQRGADFFRRGLERIEGRWSGRGYCHERYLDNKHPYAHDLDLFGPGSLFELICTARTLAGQRVLAYWLLHPASPSVVRGRQEAVEELTLRLDVRERLALAGDEMRRGTRAGALPRWGEAPAIPHLTRVRLMAAGLASFNVLAAVGVFSMMLPPAVFAGSLALAAGFGLLWRKRVFAIVAAVEQPARDLEVLAEVLALFEKEPFQSRRLREIKRALKSAGQPPSRRISRLNRLIEILDSRDHLLVRLIGPPLFWTTQVSLAVEAWRRQTGRKLRPWLEAVGEFEALCSFAGYAYEHRHDTFPKFVEVGACFEGEGLGHPLIPEIQCVRNDVRLDATRQVLLVSGSNMSGKSTLLRTVGINAVLALAGAPVRATRLRLSPLKVGAAIQVTDSLQNGISRFYAEIKRIRQLMDMTNGEGALLFLLDELLHGTNSRDRRIGAEAIVKKLVEQGALGLVTTHDLAIAHIERDLEPRVRNVHFQDHLENGEMKFDYKLRPGIVEHSNAVELMRSVGLEV